MAERSIVHGSFTIERKWPAPPAKVFRAWADPALKQQWFGSPEPGNMKHTFDFRVGGSEHSEGKGPDGGDYIFDVRYYDIIPDNRIVYAYDMHLNGERISVSVCSIEFRPDGGGTHIVLTEYGAFLDGLDTNEQRREGTVWLVDALGSWLEKQS